MILLSCIIRPSTAIHRAAASLAASLSLLIATNTGFAGSFTISGPSTTAQTLGSSSGQTGLVTTTGSLNVNGSTVAVTITGNNETLTNQGVIYQSGSGRVIRDNTGVTGLVVTNTTGALMETANADVIQMNVSPASVVLNNYGSMISLTPTASGGQAVDFNAITSGANSINNFSGGLLKAFNADAVRPGVNGVIYNAGTIVSGTGNTTGNASGNDGIDAQNNTGVSITNDTTGIIEGARHGITGGADNLNITMSGTNNAGGVIKGDDGSGINIDGFGAAEVVTFVNHGTITGDGVTSDGDGVDVDGLVNLTNTGLIQSLNSVGTSGTQERSEGVTVGGGTIVNSGTIAGFVANGNSTAVGRGITLAGVDKDMSGNAIPLQGIYANSTVTNGGLIEGQSDSGISVGGTNSGFTVTINNLAGGTIEGGGTTAAIYTGSDSATINEAGTISGTDGKAIDFGTGNGTLNITGGSASIIGNISGGTAGSAMTIDATTGNSFSYAGSISNFNSVQVKSGTVTLSGSSNYAGATMVTGGTLVVSGSLTATVSGTVAAGATLQVDGKFNNTATITDSGTVDGVGSVGTVAVKDGGTLSPGHSPGILSLSGSLTFSGAQSVLSIAIDKTTALSGAPIAGSDYSQVDVTGTGISLNNASLTLNGLAGNLKVDDLLFLILNGAGSGLTGTFDNLPQGAMTTLVGNPGVQFEISYTASESGDSFAGAGHDVALQVVTVPEPSVWMSLALGSALLLGYRRKTGRRS